MSGRSSLPTALVVMGVSGSGKSTVAERLAARLGWPFRDGDSFHSAHNIARMQAGIPLTDADRKPWLAAIAAWIGEHRNRGEHAIVACSALKRCYRDILRDGHADVRFVYLEGTAGVVAARLALRKDHFMPPALLESQFAALEAPTPDEWPITVSIDREPGAIVDDAMRQLSE